jgi:hypothetical protein
MAKYQLSKDGVMRQTVRVEFRLSAEDIKNLRKIAKAYGETRFRHAIELFTGNFQDWVGDQLADIRRSE